VSIKRELRRLVGRLRAIQPCPSCGIAREDLASPTRVGGTILATRTCPACGGARDVVFTLLIGDRRSELEAEHHARQLADVGMTTAAGWTLRPDVAEAMARLELDC
jgi:hypothetical protein